MKTFKLFESSIIGLLVGVVFSTYILFMESTGRFVGDILNSISLKFILNSFPIQYKDSIIVTFLFFVSVFVVYAIVLNLIFRVGRKTIFATSFLIILLLTGICFQQKEAFNQPLVLEDYMPVQSGALASNQGVKKYFGEEVFGDLNNDSREDVAFLIKRNEGDERGEMYYLSASLKTGEGYTGANLLYVGENIIIKSIVIENQIIKVSYIDKTEDEEEANVSVYFAKFKDSVLEEVEEVEGVEEVENQDVVEESSVVQ